MVEVTDGRRQRRETNRAAVITALVSLFAEGVFQPTGQQIAQRAGVSIRGLWRYFDDLDDLVGAAVADHLERVAPLLTIEVDVADSLASRIDALVRRRLQLWDAVAPSARVARWRATTSPFLRSELHLIRTTQREQVAGYLAPELQALPRVLRASVLAAADVLCSFESYEILTDDHGFDADARRLALRNGLERLFR